MLAGVFTVAWPGSDVHAARKAILDNPDGVLSATEYYSMLPFVIPIINGDNYKQQLTLVIAIGLFNDGDRDELRRITPIFRDAIYQKLFKLIMFRTAKPRIPPKSSLERQLLPVFKKLGGKMVKTIKIHKMFVGNRP